MFPTISDLLAYLFGIHIPLPIQTFGFMMAVSFAGAYYATSAELKRKEEEGLIHSFKVQITRYARVSKSDFIINALVGAAIGYKVVYALLNYDLLVADPQAMILSTEGSFLGLVVGGAWGYYQKWKEDQLAAKHTPVTQTVDIHPYELMWNVVFISAITGLLGAKIFHNLENLDQFAKDPIGALFSFSGLTFYGGLIVAAISVLYYTGKKGIPARHMVDAAAPALMLAYGLGRIGCQLSGDGDWGLINIDPKPEWMSFLPDWMWGFQYPHNVINEGIRMLDCNGPHCFMLPEPVYPTPFYESVVSLLLFGLLWVVRKRFTTPGMLFCVYLILNGFERFMIEKIRVNTTYNYGDIHITQAEIISTLLMILGAVGIILLSRKGAKTQNA